MTGEPSVLHPRSGPNYRHVQGGTLPIAAMVSVGLLWSVAGVLIKFVPWPPLAIWSARSAIAAVTMIAILRPSWRGVTRTEWFAGVSLAVTTALFIAANKYTTAANAILIQYSAPAWVALLSALWLGERASRRDWLTIVVALAGIVLFFFDRLTFDHVTGNLLALAAGVAFAVHAVMLRRLAQHGMSPVRAIVVGHVIAAVVGAPAVLAAGPLPGSGWLALLALGVVQQSLPGFLYAWAIQRVTALEGLLLPILEPIASPVWVWLAFGEQPARWALAGGVLVVGAVTVRAVLGLRSSPAIATTASDSRRGR
jgi:drug/metabolite transporter (DMT)-like permease